VLAGIVLAPLTVAACSQSNPKPAVSSSSSSSTTTQPPKQVATGKGLPADLLAVMTSLYVGGSVPASADMRAALARRKPLGTSVTVAGRTGTWKGTPIATITQGKDVTLLAKGKTWQVVGGWWPSMAVARPAFGPVHVLAVGSDARSGQVVDQCRGDALHVIGVDSKAVGGMVGIPRDSWVPISGGGTSKINSALVYSGINGLVSTVAHTSGLSIDGYVLTGFKGFRGMVRNLGGILFVARSSLKSVDGVKILRPGTNRLTDTTALALARERHHLSNGDFGRSANQGLLIRAGMLMAKKAGPGELSRYLTVMSPWLATNLGVGQILNLCASLYLTDVATMPNKVVQGAVGMRDGQSVVLLGPAAKATFADLRDGRLHA
jgi:LCP family protein required for cell wall assembly